MKILGWTAGTTVFRTQAINAMNHVTQDQYCATYVWIIFRSQLNWLTMLWFYSFPTGRQQD